MRFATIDLARNAEMFTELGDMPREELLFDPHTYALLGEAQVVVRPPSRYHVKPGSVRTGSTYVTQRIVERLGQTR